MFLLAFVHALSLFQAIAAHESIQNILASLNPGLQFDTSLHNSESCKQTPPLFPKQSTLDQALEELFRTDKFKKQTANALSTIIRVPTVTNDDFLPVGQDSRWELFGDLHTELQLLFPLVFSSLKVTKINTYNLVFHWQGSNPSLKPVLTTAHQDVVPVEPSTLNQWKYPPFSGFYDGTWIWGRGSCDDKSDLISQLTSIQSLLEHGFLPIRTFVFAYGIDEESAGTQGAGKIAQYLEATYGRDGFAALVDEGYGFGIPYGGDILFAGPGTGEKGYLDVHVEVTTPGGHSSVPPRHTAIGILASVITTLESNPYPLDLSRTSTAFQQVECEATYGPLFPSSIRDLVNRVQHNDSAALVELARALVDLEGMRGRLYEALITTTQAVDLVTGGVKVNALPEKAEAVVNYRIAQESSVSAVQERFTSTILPVAQQHNLTLRAFGLVVHDGSSEGSVTLSTAWGNSLEPAPRTPTNLGSESDEETRPYELLMGTIKAALKASPEYSNKEVVVMPTLMFGNTDTASYWNLTKHIYRYGHFSEKAMYNGEHTVNEALNADALVEKIRFHTKWILNWDEAEF
ncbi:carboxypeptidase S [Irpex rosettiformis]|uniref:Carboxypeptidase S n=1 Tax=Irpex rosettiformis TaxID=378272 RepID=A0ACB8UBV1_9APHY|nr:carboxypeptidase S [Irpex rosettiformis]